MKKQLIHLSLLCTLGIAGLPAGLHADNVYTIYPIPQEQTARNGNVSLSATVNVVCDPGIDQYTKDRAQEVLGAHGIQTVFAESAAAGQTNLYLGVAGSNGAADQKATEQNIDRSVLSLEGKFDRHIVSLSAEDGQALLIILGENTDATFYGLASLEQMLDGGTAQMPCVTINDYADQQSRGLVEGYYGYPYSVDVKKDIMKFMARYKLNTYLYGAKSDPYHSGYYLDPYPTTITEQQERNGWLTQAMFKDLTATAHATKVNFIWAIHPGLNTTTEQHVTDVMEKFKLMYDLGVRQFAVFTDDAGGYDNADNFPLYAQFFTSLQNQIDATWNVPGAAPADTVKPLHYVPHVYNLTWTNQSNRQAYFAALSAIPEKIVVYTTGYGVWSVPNNSDLITMKNELGRNVAWWWNYPCNDNGRSDSQIFPSSMYTNFVDMTQVNSNATLPSSLNNSAGILSNPMQQGEISKIALFSVADYAWNNDCFDNEASWEAAIPAVISEDYAAAFCTLAPYLRDNDPAELTTLVNQYKSRVTNGMPGDATALKQEMDKILQACDVVAGMETSEVESDRLFFNDMRPWFYLVRDMAATVNAFFAAKEIEAEDTESRWTSYLSAQKMAEAFATDEKYIVSTLEGMGTNPPVGTYQVNASAVSLKPFATEWLGNNDFNDLFPERTTADGPVVYSTIADLPTMRATAHSTGTYINSTYTPTLAPGDLIGIQLEVCSNITDLIIADTLYNNFDIVYSENGKQWATLEAGALPSGPCKYVCLRNKTDENRSVRFSRTSFRVRTQAATSISGATLPDGEVWSGHSAELLYDGSYETFCTLNRNQSAGDTYMVTLQRAVPVHDVRICVGTTNDDYMNEARVQISNDGKSWRTLRVRGTTNFVFTMSNPAVVKYSDDMSYCDFTANGDSARYVRLYVSSPNTRKWLRLYEIEVNKFYDQYGGTPIAESASGEPIEALFDNKPSTYYATGQSGSLVYNLLNPDPVDYLTFYIDDSESCRAVVEATLDGEEWTAVDSLSGAVSRVSLAAAGLSRAIAVRVTWEGASPVIHEICEERSSTPTAIGEVTLAAGENGVRFVPREDGMTVEAAATGIRQITVYAVDGRTLLTIRGRGEASVEVPRVHTPVALISVETTDGQTTSFSVLQK